MTLKTWVYTVTLRTKIMRSNMGLTNYCHRCGDTIEIGEKIYSRNASSRKSKSKIYHYSCAEAVNIL